MKLYYITYRDGDGDDCAAFAAAETPGQAVRLHMAAVGMEPWEFTEGIAEVWAIPSKIVGPTSLDWADLESEIVTVKEAIN